jgi:hypothetical protein
VTCAFGVLFDDVFANDVFCEVCKTLFGWRIAQSAAFDHNFALEEGGVSV